MYELCSCLLITLAFDTAAIKQTAGGRRYRPGPALSVRSVSGAAAVSNVVAVDGDELLAALRRLLLLPEPVVLPAALVLPQLPVSSFGSERGDAISIHTLRLKRALI